MRGLMLWGMLVVGCDDGEDVDPDFPWSCDQSKVDGDCITYSGARWTERSLVETRCKKGEIVVGDCPDDAIGTCLVAGDSPDETLSFFYEAFWTVENARDRCLRNDGTWTET